MKHQLLLALFLGIVSLTVTAQKDRVYHVTSKTLNLREEASKSSEVIKKLNQHDNVIILGDSNGIDWCKVKINGTEGYVSKKYISEGKCVIRTYTVRVGAVCKDGTLSSATGRGACSHHGGVARWRTQTKKSVSIEK